VTDTSLRDIGGDGTMFDIISRYATGEGDAIETPSRTPSGVGNVTDTPLRDIGGDGAMFDTPLRDTVGEGDAIET
jgi:hypothetical protein